LATPKLKATRVSPNIKKFFDKIIEPKSAFFRGFHLGIDTKEIKTKEKFKLFEKDTDHVGYSYETSNFEMVDILYFEDVFKRLHKIHVDIYMNDEKTSSELYGLFFAHFEEAHGTPKKYKDQQVFVSKEYGTVRLTHIISSVEHGISIEFSK
jgi:hypothetical protein